MHRISQLGLQSSRNQEVSMGNLYITKTIWRFFKLFVINAAEKCHLNTKILVCRYVRSTHYVNSLLLPDMCNIYIVYANGLRFCLLNDF